MKLKNLLKENPDTISTEKFGLDYSDSDAYAFGFHKGKAYIGDPGNTHYDIRGDLLDRGDITGVEYQKIPRDRFGYKYTGRFWTRKKVISFWDYPTENQMKGLISKLEKAGGMKLWNNGWKIEIIDKGGKIYRPTKRERRSRLGYREIWKCKVHTIRGLCGKSKTSW